VQHKALAAGAAHHEALEKYLQGNREQLAQLAGDCAAAGKDLAGITAALNEMEAEWRTGLESLQKEWSRGEARITEGNRARDSRMKALTDTATQALQRSEDVRQALVTAEHRLAELATLATRLQSVEDVQALEVADMDAMAFMERFRGSEDEIRRRLQPYVALFAEGSEPPPGPILDLGCGRGEFLELCRRQNIEAEGLEHDPELVRLLRSRGHTIHEKDALNCLRACDASALGGIFSAQVIEHLPAGATIQLVKEAHRTLAPGGMLILETLNPASLAVLATTFYRDPGHRQPMHPETAGFILESAGFAEVRIVQHTPVPTEHALLAVTGREDDPVLAGVNRNVRILNHLLFGPQEYHVIGVRR
jgi:O-antigen chain-terminating methyltransferase